jgi:hypothetical protein
VNEPKPVRHAPPARPHEVAPKDPSDRNGAALRRGLIDVRQCLDAWGREFERSRDAVLWASVVADELLQREHEAWDAYVRATATLKRELRHYRAWHAAPEGSEAQGPSASASYDRLPRP